MNRNRTKQTALCGIMAALSVVILVIGAAIGIGLYAAPMVAIAILIPVISECGNKAGYLAYICVCILSLMLVPDPEVTVVYVAFGWYPMTQKYVYKAKNRWLRLFVLLAVYAVIILVPFRLLYLILGISELLKEEKIITYSLAALGAIVFVLFDFVLIRARVYWQKVLKKKVGY